MADSSPAGDQPRATAKQMPDAGRDPSISYRTAPIKSYNPRRPSRKPTRS